MGEDGDGSDGGEAGDGEERAVCRLSSLVFDADSAKERVDGCGGDGEGGRAGVGSDEGEGGDGDDGCAARPPSQPSSPAASAARGASQQAASALGEGPGGEEPRRKELDEVGFRGAKKGRCAARNAPTKWTAGNEMSFFQRS